MSTGEGMQFLRIKEVQRKTAKSKSSIYGDPSFPKPVKIGVQSSAWIASEIESWMASRAKDRNDARDVEER